MTIELFIFKTKWGQAAVHLSTVLGILPDTESKSRSIVITTFEPEGISAEENSSTLTGKWSELLDELDEELGEFEMALEEDEDE